MLQKPLNYVSKLSQTPWFESLSFQGKKDTEVLAVETILFHITVYILIMTDSMVYAGLYFMLFYPKCFL